MSKIAIVGMGGVFPQAPDLDRFWEILRNGRDAARPVSEGRWPVAAELLLDPEGPKPDRVYALQACLIEEGELPPLEFPGQDELATRFAGLDPLFGLGLRAARQAWADARMDGVDPARVGVILGNIVLPTDASSRMARELLGAAFEAKVLGEERRPRLKTEPLNRCAAGLPALLISEAFGLGGPAFTLDAACASSLYALKLACDALRDGEVDAVLSGGLSRPDSLYTQMGFSQLKALATRGKSAPFDESASGLVVGEGAGIFVLKRLEDALAQGDRIHGLIAGTGLSNDLVGNLLAPSSEGQLRAMRAAYAEAGWQPWDLDSIECHATGTPLGDAVEFESLQRLWGDAPADAKSCVLGSVKANIGHLLTAAGAASLMKGLLSLRHDCFTPTANFTQPSAKIVLEGSRFRVLRQSEPWLRADRARRFGVSAFGFGGINAHLLIEEWIPAGSWPSEREEPARRGEVAIVGLAVRVGDSQEPEQIRRELLGLANPAEPVRPAWWGLEEAWPEGRDQAAEVAGTWQADGSAGAPLGRFARQCEIPVGKYRIPPNELEEMLPQQLFALETASAALADAGLSTAEANPRAGVFLGIGLDPNTSNFQLRWGLEARAREWASQLGLEQSLEMNAWLASLRQELGPALNANRTIGALGGMVASRLAREFRMGGPSFTLSSEETSGISALAAAARALATGELDLALAGAVDLSGDPRTLLGQGRAISANGRSSAWSETSSGATAADGAVVLVLKRLEDAERDGNRIYARLESARQRRSELELGLDCCGGDWLETAACGDERKDASIAAWLTRALERGDAISPTRSEGCRDPWLGALAADLGECGAASALLAVARGALAIYHRVLPPLRGLEPLPEGADPADRLRSLAGDRLAERIPVRVQHWLRNESDGPRRALCLGEGSGGDRTRVSLLEYRGERGFSPLMAEPGFGVLALQGTSHADLAQKLTLLLAWLAQQRGSTLHSVSAAGSHLFKQDEFSGFGLAFCVESLEKLTELLQLAVQTFAASPPDAGRDWNPESNPDFKHEVRAGRIFYRERAEDWRDRVAFVFPGSGSHYPDMGRELALTFPRVFLEQATLSPSLADQLRPDLFWNGKPGRFFNHRHALLLSTQVALGAAVADVGRELGLRPCAMIGYSLGESTMMFASRAWNAREEMFRATQTSDLFQVHLAGPCESARSLWQLAEDEPVDWVIGVVNRPAEKVRTALARRRRAYLLIINTHKECVIGGQRAEVEATVAELDCVFFPLNGVVTVHCEVLAPVAARYRAHHLFPSHPPLGLRYYGGARETAFVPSTEAIADEIHDQAHYGIDFPRTIEAAYADGIRAFIEIGPGSSCARMIGRILRGRPHFTRSLCFPGNQEQNLAQTMAALAALGLLSPCHANSDSPALERSAQLAAGSDALPSQRALKHAKRIAIGGAAYQPPKPPISSTSPQPKIIPQSDAIPPLEPIPQPLPTAACQPFDNPPQPLASPALLEIPDIPELAQILAIQESAAAAHAQYLSFSQTSLQGYGQALALHSDLLQLLPAQSPAPTPSHTSGPVPAICAPVSAASAPASRRTHDLASAQAIAGRVVRYEPNIPMFFNRSQCLAFAVGRIGVLLPEFAEVDQHPTRVRLPDEPLMLCDRILIAEGTRMSHGRCVTEHDVLEQAWYLDCGRIPTCIAVEAGQADLFLSAFLGIDLETKGLFCYRLLDAVVTFHDQLPRPGQVIRYDIRINRFFRQGRAWFFHFQFDGTCEGKPLLTMRDGCAGFFDDQELAAGRGIFRSRLQRKAGGAQPGWSPLLPDHAPESYDDRAIDALRSGRLDLCFGSPFDRLPLRNPVGLPGELLTLVHRVLLLQPRGGEHGLGFIRAEADIHPDDWFLTSHFVDDRVMPGTLMYECCMHSLRILLLRLGWVGESGKVVYQPVPGVASVLKCRGQVLETTRKVRYEVTIKEIGYRPEPYVISDALMYSDDRCIVEIGNMSLRMTGVDRTDLEQLWQTPASTSKSAHAETKPAPPLDSAGLCGGFPPLPAVHKPALYDRDRVLAYAVGKPSEAFGDPYRCFDEERIIARLPGPPFMFLDRLVRVEAPPWVLEAGGLIEGQYDIPADAWYFSANKSGKMPFVVLLEIALQPCGWFAAYMGSALTSQTDLKFRNLGGKGILFREIRPDTGLLAIDVRVTKISSSGGMIIQNFDFAVRDGQGPLYIGDTYFGFFSQAALANQVGVREARPWRPTPADLTIARRFEYPFGPAFPEPELRMIDQIEILLPEGGPHGLGYIEGSKNVDPAAWFFKAHFYQDPVIPGSLGLESMIQLLKAFAAARWGLSQAQVAWRTPVLGQTHEWIYRGQVIPANMQVIVQAEITAIDDQAREIKADGYLSADGKIIYQMKDFTLGC